MKLNRVLATATFAFSSLVASAQVAVFNITDLLTSQSYTDSNTAQTFNGTGFVGLYSTAGNGSDAFAHLFGLEQSDYSRTALQVDVSSLIGLPILSATLSYDLLHGYTANQTVTATAYTSNGSLGYFWNAPSNIGQVSFTSFGQSPNSVDVTALLTTALGNGDSWFGLHLQGSSEYQWTYTLNGDIDAANVRLTVNYLQAGPPGAVPEPSTYGMIGAAALAGLVAWRRFRQAARVL